MKYLVASFILLAASGVGLVTLSSSAQTQQGQKPSPNSQSEECQVSGTVVDESGKPVSSAEVTTEITDIPLSRLPKTVTDEQGNFSFGYVTCGHNQIWAAKEEAGYGALSRVWSDKPAQSIVAEPGKPLTNVVVMLGPKTPRLTGRVVSTANGKAIKDAYIVVRRADDPDVLIGMGVGEDGSFSVFVPSGQFTLQVTAPNYKDWKDGQTGDPKVPKNVMSLKADKINQIQVQLEPNH